MAEQFANNTTTTVSSGGTDAPSSGTSQSWTVASSSSFPATPFHVADPAAATEKVAVTNVSGTTWTVTRGAESTTPVAHSAGFTVVQVVTAGVLGTFAQAGSGDLGGTGGAPTVTGTHLASALPLAQGGTGQATQQAAMDALAGAQTSGQVLRGNGTHVVLGAIQAGDVPTLNQNTTGTAGALAGQVTFTYGSTGAVPSSGTYTAGELVVDQNNIPRVCTAGGTPGTWRRAYAQPYDFWIDDYGAVGNATECLVTTTAGSKNITSTTAVFTSTGVDGGKDIMICGAGGAVPGGPDIDTIATVTDSTHAVLTNNVPAGGSGSGLACVFASSDRTAFDNCIAAAQTYAVAHGYFARVLWSDKKYSVGTGLFQSVAGVSGALLSYNVQIRAAVGTDLTGESGKLEIQYLGPTAGAQCRFWTATGEDAPGAVIFSFSSGPNVADGTFGQQAIMGFPIGGAGISNDAGFFNVKAVVKGLTFVQPGWSNSIGLDLYTAAEHDISVTSSVFAPSTTEGGGVNPYIGWFTQSFWINNKIAIGVRLSKAQQNDQCESDICAQGMNIAVFTEADHVILKRLSVAAVDTVLKMNVGGNTQHEIEGRISAENYNNGIVTVGTISRIMCHLTWDAEMSNNSIAGNDFADTNGNLFGDVWWSDFSRSTGGLANIIVPTVSGCQNLRIHNVQLTQQVYDASGYSYSLGTAFQNPWWENVTITLAGGTVTGISVGAVSGTVVSLGITSGTFRLPTGWWLKIAGSGKPTTLLAVPG